MPDEHRKSQDERKGKGGDLEDRDVSEGGGSSGQTHEPEQGADSSKTRGGEATPAQHAKARKDTRGSLGGRQKDESAYQGRQGKKLPPADEENGDR